MTAVALTQGEAFARIRLLRSANIGPISYAQLLGRFGTAVAAVEALPDLASRGARRDYRPAPSERIEREIAAARKAGARYVFHDSADYPRLLGELESAPPIITVRGDMALATKPCVALVGARNASAAAVKLARDLSRDLADGGFTVVSGLARGIDGACHEGALHAGGGATIGVIASGIDVAYPPQHADLQERIAREALLIAEEAPGTEPRGSHFPKRNRIIAGLAAGTLVVEAAPKSGSLITARLAGEAGREVMAIPGSPLEARSQGCNQLIREGAVLVQSAADVIELLSAFDGSPVSSFREPAASIDWSFVEETESEPAAVTDLLTTAPVAVDELIRQSGASAGAVQMALLELEIAGNLVRHAGGRVSLTR
ncbi:DNA-protecting protein DprA [Erythrobacter arachoides]|uniref:DNA-protecting protein DprA n=1 Tax=Aurantiacibacter arachoides TaxID=1850444 RepID=A0A845A1F0_9SPHN|nr:DNA-processing protein DprA [Aurantiacibacter arachoides]MXO92956.1 DNA-protecting protein DprA [Aurantiacibacter arachoides]GGD53177.1 DNA processing protein DprA [Aurantiacibacter arachoides]